eukprot:2576876-Rhodomonas_salina.1
MKSANVLLFEDGRKVKLADFGSCFVRLDANWQGSVSLATQSTVGWTKRYMQPERIRDKRVAHPSGDVWGFGLVVHE